MLCYLFFKADVKNSLGQFFNERALRADKLENGYEWSR